MVAQVGFAAFCGLDDGSLDDLLSVALDEVIDAAQAGAAE